MGLFPFPRVGRAGNEIPWANGYPGKRKKSRYVLLRYTTTTFTIPRADLSKMHELKTRQGLMPFPRVGRSDLRPWMFGPDALIEYQKRNGNGGLWFGPRLGRLQKRSYDSLDAPWTFIALKGSPIRLDYPENAEALK